MRLPAKVCQPLEGSFKLDSSSSCSKVLACKNEVRASIAFWPGCILYTFSSRRHVWLLVSDCKVCSRSSVSRSENCSQFQNPANNLSETSFESQVTSSSRSGSSCDASGGPQNHRMADVPLSVYTKELVMLLQPEFVAFRNTSIACTRCMGVCMCACRCVCLVGAYDAYAHMHAHACNPGIHANTCDKIPEWVPFGKYLVISGPIPIWQIDKQLLYVVPTQTQTQTRLRLRLKFI